MYMRNLSTQIVIKGYFLAIIVSAIQVSTAHAQTGFVFCFTVSYLKFGLEFNRTVLQSNNACEAHFLLNTHEQNCRF